MGLSQMHQSIVFTALDITSIITNGGLWRMDDCMDLLNVLACMYLFVVSIRGRTGISVSWNGLTDPLLHETTEDKWDSPYGRATFIQLVTFSWLNPLFAAGIKKPLEQDEIPDVDVKDSAKFSSHSFDDSLNNAKERNGGSHKPSSIYKAIFIFVRRKAAINASFAVVSAATSYVGPSLIDDFVKFLNDKKNRNLKSGYLLALAFLSAKMIEVVAQRQWIFGARQLGCRLRAALISQIYKKGLRLSSQSRQGHTSGEIINYMSVDIQRITDLMWYANTIWMLPIQISLAIYVLYTNLGLGSLAGLAATALVMACNVPLTRIQKRLQSKIMEAKDERMKATSEVLRNMRSLKLQAWDMRYLHKLDGLRKIECSWLWKSARLNALSAFIFWGSPTLISAATFGACILMGIPLTAGRVLSALATFRMLQDPIFNLPDLLSVLAMAKVSGDRIASYLQEDEIHSDAVESLPRNEAEFEIEINNGRFSWDLGSSDGPTLSGIHLNIKRGMKVAICGAVGSGKSSLLSCILGEIPKLSGKVKISGTKAYVPQSPWILTGNVRENILFGKPFDNGKYQKTVEACALMKDFELFATGDLTEIGERGINMSGGQKQRIQIARAVYQDADIYLLDDPFSAVDAHTGTQLFKNCLMGMLKEKTVLYVTHQVEFLPAADLILVMQNGQITQAGKFDELLQQNVGFEVLVGAHSQALETIQSAEISSRRAMKLLTDDNMDTDAESTATVQFQNGDKHNSGHNLCPEIERTDKGGRLTQDEEREKGSIGKDVYWAYLTAVKGGALVPIILTAQSLFQTLQIASNYWITWASPPTKTSESKVTMNVLFMVYILLSVGSALCVLVRASLVAIVGLRTSQKFFMNMLQSILHAPMSFFDSTPTGRILNRQYYIPTARELARLAGIQRAPILHHFAESLTGAATIRAFNQEDRFINTNLNLIDNHSRPWFHNVSAMEWLSFRLNLLSNFVFAFSLVLLVSLPEGIISPKNKMISVERIQQYSRIVSEAPLVIEECRPPPNWPAFGTICFKNLQVRYAEHLPSVLKNITCTFPGKMKVGVVGRTGSGKSTLIQAIFRIVEPREGSIVIDDVDICKIGLHDLRSRLSIIPQDPTMFEGTVRGNLDPLEEHQDDRVWEAMVENGENWSVGQRQLFCLGRALLRRSSILVLDEATASVDSATDGVIQQIIRQEFRDRTVVTIAHRIHTVIDSDLVLVLSEGRVHEFDAPENLLEREDSAFSKLIREYSLRSRGLTN
ncbi:ABC transporter C family member 9 [Acorus gramineus]|uniref:ABC transporter C family member 9 n=1 Tax=Acorus gramineus TaxID=55184 RepID=A0AAV9ADF3_ACOGR|nr:ABC transporter C family member 9 [Acorus gramineus]